MFNNLSDRILKTFDGLLGKGILTEEDVTSAMREIRVALLEADVPLDIAKDFVEKVKSRAVGEKLLKSIKPGDLVVKIVHDSLIELLSSGLDDNKFNLNINKTPTVILMVGLQGSGKTTTAAKLANLLKLKKKKVLLSSLDISRPAAIEQLLQLSNKIEVNCMNNEVKDEISTLISNTLEEAKKSLTEVIIFDTSGRTNIDEELLRELKDINKLTNPDETLLVTDSMIGQESVNVAKAFSDYVDLTGVILTRVDGDAKGGAALSMAHTTGKPIKFLGVGEKIDQIEVFSAKRLADRILDMGDIVGIVEKAEKDIDEKEAEEMARKMASGTFDLNDFNKQLSQMKKLGGIKGIMSLLPGVRKAKKTLQNSNLEDKTFFRMSAIICSMTKKEKIFPKIINGSRKKRIAKGSGVDIQDVNRLLKQFKNMQIMMKKMNKHGISGIEKMLGNNLSSNNLENIYSNLKR
ncbi:MAG: signal recognition particle protein [Rickettsiales bacterium]|nr:signal recognition particle protein [Rickettsiales bacterium]|tara:strand:+ start:486 stop:1874 length:1389 start_codon:yes stop_codon:yes gene_type:complete